MLPGRPLPDEVRVGDQHARRPLVGPEHARPACRDWTSSVSSSREPAQLADDRVERLPAPRRAAGAAVDDEVVGVLGDLGVEVVHEHPQRGLLLPAAGQTARAARGADRARAGRPRRRPRSLMAAASLRRARRRRRARRQAGGRSAGPPSALPSGSLKNVNRPHGHVLDARWRRRRAPTRSAGPRRRRRRRPACPDRRCRARRASRRRRSRSSRPSRCGVSWTKRSSGADPVVVVEVEPDLVDVEGDRAVDVRDRRSPTSSSLQSIRTPPVRRWAAGTRRSPAATAARLRDRRPPSAARRTGGRRARTPRR